MLRHRGIAEARDDAFIAGGRIVVTQDEPYTSGSTIVADVADGYEYLTPHNAVLLLVDHQIGPLWEIEFAPTRRTVVALATLATEIGLPTIISAIGVERWGPIVPELTAAAPAAPHIVRATVNAWEEPSLRNAVAATNRHKLLIAGGAADIGVALCALAAAHDGYDVYTLIDASGRFSHGAIARLSRAGVIVTTTALVSAELMSFSGEARRSSPPDDRR
jgi:nicotinamidase-related amidase